MLKSTLEYLKNRFAPSSRTLPVREISRRTTHGSTAWTTAAEQDNTTLYQPQDGAPERGRVAEFSARLRKALPGEPEDARLTGGTRSLTRRVSGLNLRVHTLPTVARANVA